MVSLATPTFAPGTVLDGKYVVESVLGRGGMGEVFAVRHRVLGTEHAIKLLLPEAQDPDSIERFHREARSAVRLTSPHVGRVHDVGSLADGTPYMVMERLRGCDLDGVLKTQGPLPPDLVIRYALQALASLAEAHALGIVHRDIKPANLFLAEQPDGSAIVKVLDFGIARGFDEGGDRLTQTKDVMGSPTYMSPEQMRAARAADARSDLWSFGVTLYELLAGRAPFVANSLADLMVAVLHANPPPLTTFRPNLPPGLAETIHRCLEKAPESRFQSAAELSEALTRVGRGEGLPLSSPLLPIAADSSWSRDPTVYARPGAPRGTLVPILLGALVGSLALVAGIVIIKRPSHATSKMQADPVVSASVSPSPSAPEPVVLTPDPPPPASAASSLASVGRPPRKPIAPPAPSHVAPPAPAPAPVDPGGKF